MKKALIIIAIFSLLLWIESIPYTTGVKSNKLSSKPAIFLGKVHTPWFAPHWDYKSYQSYQEAKSLGADFVLVINKDPSRFDFRSLSDFAFSNSTSTSYCGCYRNYGFYTAWAYLPANLGIKTKNFVVTGFDPGSKSENVKIGDEIIGINGIERNNENFYKQLLNVYPDNTVTLNILRGKERLDINIIAIKP